MLSEPLSSVLVTAPVRWRGCCVLRFLLAASALLLVAASATAAPAADLNGIWVGYTTARNGDRVDVTLKLTADATGKIGGKLYGDYKSNPVTEGTVSGDDVNFLVVASEQAGNQINDSRIRFTGKFLNEHELELTRERESTSNAGNKGDSTTNTKPQPKTVIKFKRLI
jgi:hypothetical protein